MSFLVIPTHRLVERAIASAITEISHYPQEFSIIVVDNSCKDIYNKNCKIINEFKKDTPSIYHYGLSDQKDLIDLLSRKTGYSYNELMTLLYPNNVDYGKIFNIIYLIICTHGGDRFHRRDSDCFVRDLQHETHPLFLEVRYLAKNTSLFNNGLGSTDEEIFMVGSDYLGDWNIDVKELQEEDSRFLHKFYELSNLPKHEIDKYIHEKYFSEDYDVSKKPILDNGANELYNWLEIGNMSMYELFKWIPNFFGVNAVGFDYHTYNVACIWNLPTVYHFNKILHTHDKLRKDFTAQKHYWKGILKMNDYNVFIHEFAMVCKSQFPSGVEGLMCCVSNGELVKLMSQVVNKLNRKQRLERISAVVSMLSSSKHRSYMDISEWLYMNKSSILSEVTNEYIMSIRLQEIWRSLIQAACDIANETAAS